MTNRATTVLPQCLQLLHQFFHHLDQYRYESLIELFEPDATWHRQGAVLRGHDEIREALVKRSTTQRIRHVLSNTAVVAEEADSVWLSSYMTAYRFDNGVLPVGLVTIDGPLQMYALNAQVCLKPQRASISALEITPEFRFATSMAAN